MRTSGARRAGLICVTAVLAVFIACTLTACGRDETETSRSEAALYYLGCGRSEDGTYTAYVGLSGEESNKLAASAGHIYDLRRDGAAYKMVTLTYVIDPSVTEELKTKVIEETGSTDAADGLKAVFRCATIYKSYESNGVIFRSGRNYIHDFALGTDGVVSAVLTRRAADSAVWYGALIGAGSAAFITAAVIVAALKNRRGKNGGESEEINAGDAQ